MTTADTAIRTINITPRPGVIWALANQKLSTATVLGELIENALDAGATEIDMIHDDHRLIMRDNGVGIKDLEAMATLGMHVESGPNGIGMYGVGFKDAACWFGGETIVKTWRDGQEWRLDIDWRALMKQTEWTLEAPAQYPSERPTPSGTELTFLMPIMKLRRIPDVLDTMSFTYTPALRAGVQMRWRKDGPGRWRDLQPMTPPTTIGEILVMGSAGGKSFRITAGVVAAGELNPYYGVHLVYRNRVLRPSCNLGCGNAPVTRLYAWCELLGDGWEVTKNKTALSEGDEDALDDALVPVMQPIVARAEQESQLVRLPTFEKAIAELFGGNDIEVLGKEQRGEGDTHETAEPTGTGSKRLRASVVQPGSKRLRKLQGGIKLVWADTPTSHPTIQVKLRENLIVLNRHSPVLKRIRSSQDLERYALGTAIISAISAELEEDQLSMLDAPPDPGQRFSVLLAEWIPILEQEWKK